MSEFVEFAKMGRLTRECVITEKIDGTNAQIHIVPEAEYRAMDASAVGAAIIGDLPHYLLAGSRNRYITPLADNFGFAAWCEVNCAALIALGPGRHYGEWWGSGIQRRYGLTEKRFSLFNVARWHQVGGPTFISVSADPRLPPKLSTEAPACCHVVPVLSRGQFSTEHCDHVLDCLRSQGSAASPGFMTPEGIVVFHTATGTMFKKTLEKDDEPKSKYAGIAEALADR